MSLQSFSPNTKIESAKVNTNFTNLSDNGRWVNLAWNFPATVYATQVSKVYLSLPGNVTWERADVACDTAPTGQALIADIERSTDSGATWNSIFAAGNRPQAAAGARTGNTTSIDTPTGTANSHLFRAIIDQVGSTVAGADVTVQLKGKYDLD